MLRRGRPGKIDLGFLFLISITTKSRKYITEEMKHRINAFFEQKG